MWSGDALAAGIMSDTARSDRICASSKTMTSTASNPRPKPDSRAPNMMTLPLLKATSCRPCGWWTILTNLARARRFDSPWKNWNVWSDVRLLCAVHSTVRFGTSVHSMNTIVPTVKVFPVCRQIDMTMPPTLAANDPSSRFASIRRPRPSCQRSYLIPHEAALRSTEGHIVDVIPDGCITWRARSDRPLPRPCGRA